MDTKKVIIKAVGALIIGYGIYSVGFYNGGKYATNRCIDIINKGFDRAEAKVVYGTYTVE